MAGPTFDASSEPTAGTGNLIWDHTPVGTPGCATVALVTPKGAGGATAATFTGVTYGGEAMTEVANSPVIGSNGSEESVIHKFFLDDPPSGVQEVVATKVGGDTDASTGCARTYTKDSGTVVSAALTDTRNSGGATDGNSGSMANPSGKTVAVEWDFHSARDTISSITPGTGVTRDQSHDFGLQCAHFMRLDNLTNADPIQVLATSSGTDELHGHLLGLEQTAGSGEPIGQTTETDTAQAMTATKVATIAQTPETETAQPMGGPIIGILNQAVETNTASTFDPTLTGTIQQAVEREFAADYRANPGPFPWIPAFYTREIGMSEGAPPIGQAIEAEIAQPVVGAKAATIGQPSETDSVPDVLTATKSATIGQASHTNVARPMGGPVPLVGRGKSKPRSRQFSRFSSK